MKVVKIEITMVNMEEKTGVLSPLVYLFANVITGCNPRFCFFVKFQNGFAGDNIVAATI